MFKGLRAKIESEQRGQAGSASNSNNKQSISHARGLQDSHGETGDRVPIKDGTDEPGNRYSSPSSQPTLESSKTGHLVERGSTPQQDVLSTIKNEHSSSPVITTDQHTNDHQHQYKDKNADLESRISSLEDQLSFAIREREEINDQNAQLYHLIEKLRRNLETESEARSSLQARHVELEKQLTDNAEAGVHKAKNDFALNKSFNPGVTAPHPNIPHDIEALRNEVIELQAQLAKKNRQLKICQQNLTDLKKTLQKEMIDHSNAQKELLKLQEQLNVSNQHVGRGQRNDSKDSSTTTTTQNGSNN